jgi:hypothetical protein
VFFLILFLIISSFFYGDICTELSKKLQLTPGINKTGKRLAAFWWAMPQSV